MAAESKSRSVLKKVIIALAVIFGLTLIGVRIFFIGNLTFYWDFLTLEAQIITLIILIIAAVIELIALIVLLGILGVKKMKSTEEDIEEENNLR